MVTFHGMNISKFKEVQTPGSFTNVPRRFPMQVVNQFQCYRIGALASILYALRPSFLIPVRPSPWTNMGSPQGILGFFAFVPVDVTSSDDQ